MNKTENLLVSVMEECSEIQKAASKALRFGLNESFDLNPTNARTIILEFYDLTAVINKLQCSGVLPRLTVEEEEDLLGNKTKKIEFYQEISKEVGTVMESE